MELYESIRNEICEVCHLLYERGYVVSNDGNVSVRVEPDKVLITPSGVGKGRMTPDMLVLCDLQGNVLAGTRYPSSESKMHLMIYRERSDVMSVVHAHPPLSTAFSICRRPLAQHYLTETISGLGEVPVAPFALPSTSQVPDSLRPYVAGCNGALLANHGAIAWGRDLWHAFDRMEQVEQTAKIFALVHQLGGGVELSPEQVGAIRGLEGHYRTLSGSRTPHEEQGGGRT